MLRKPKPWKGNCRLRSRKSWCWKMKLGKCFMSQSSWCFFIVCCLWLSMESISSPLSCNCRFLRQRYKYLLKHPIPKPQPKQVVKPQKLKVQAPVISKGKNSNRKEPTRKEPMRPLLPSHLNPTGRISSVAEVPLQKTGHMFDLNQNARSSSKKDASSIHSSAPPALDLNHKERIHSSKEATKKSVTPFFDLNQISVIIHTYSVYITSPCLSLIQVDS